MKTLLRRLFRRTCYWCKGTGTLPCHICPGDGVDCLLGCHNGRAKCECQYDGAAQS